MSRRDGWGGLAIAVLVSSSVTGCAPQSTEPGASPRATFEAFKLAFQNKDFDAVWNLSSDAGRDQWTASLRKAQTDLRALQQQAEQAAGTAQKRAQAGLAKQEQILQDTFGLGVTPFAQMSARDLFLRVWTQVSRNEPKIVKERASATFLREDVQGDGAKVTYRRPDGREANVAMVRTGEVWKIGLPRP